MYDDFIPDCVPEYFREKIEKEQHEAELYWERQEYYDENKKNMEEAYEAGLPVLPYCGYDACITCNDADHDTQTYMEDDICYVICHNPDCPEHQKH